MPAVLFRTVSVLPHVGNSNRRKYKRQLNFKLHSCPLTSYHHHPLYLAGKCPALVPIHANVNMISVLCFVIVLVIVLVSQW